MTTAEEIQADLDSHHIEGWATVDPQRRQFNVPLISHIVGNLWMGGCIEGVRLPRDFKYVISLYTGERYNLDDMPDMQNLTVRGMLDSSHINDAAELYSTAGYVLGAMKTGKTLVHCQAGLNRSGLIAALALVLDGMNPYDAIDLLREKRSPAVLCNPAFETWLLYQERTYG